MFSPASITNIEVYIDEIHAGKARHEEGPLYTVSWRPEKYAQGLHYIRVVVQVIIEPQRKKTILGLTYTGLCRHRSRLEA